MKLIITRAVNYVSLHRRHYMGYFLFGSTFSVLAYYFKGKNNEFLRLGFAGSIAQIATELVFHPIDVINTNTKADILGNVNAYQTTKNIYNREGFFGFWRGASATYYGSLIGGMIYFTIYKWIKNLLIDEEKKNLNTIAYLVSSGLSEFLFLFIYYPYDLIRTRMQTRRPEFDYKGVTDAMRKIMKGSLLNYEHFLKLYVGAGPSFVLNISNQSIMFTVIETAREYIIKKKNYKSINQLSGIEYLSCSVLAGVVSGAITNILEVITIQKQLRGSSFHLMNFVREQGVKALTSGIFARVAINTAHTVILFYVVDVVSVSFNVEL